MLLQAVPNSVVRVVHFGTESARRFVGGLTGSARPEDDNAVSPQSAAAWCLPVAMKTTARMIDLPLVAADLTLAVASFNAASPLSAACTSSPPRHRSGPCQLDSPPSAWRRSSPRVSVLLRSDQLQQTKLFLASGRRNRSVVGSTRWHRGCTPSVWPHWLYGHTGAINTSYPVGLEGRSALADAGDDVTVLLWVPPWVEGSNWLC
jgi:hypothetical protein